MSKNHDPELTKLITTQTAQIQALLSQDPAYQQLTARIATLQTEIQANLPSGSQHLVSKHQDAQALSTLLTQTTYNQALIAGLRLALFLIESQTANQERKSVIS